MVYRYQGDIVDQKPAGAEVEVETHSGRLGFAAGTVGAVVCLGMVKEDELVALMMLDYKAVEDHDLAVQPVVECVVGPDLVPETEHDRRAHRVAPRCPQSRPEDQDILHPLARRTT